MSNTSANTLFSALLNYRTKRFWLFFLFLLYSLFGWVAVPFIVENQLGSVLKSTANWEVKIGNTVFNPYALSLEIEQASFKNDKDQQILGFERFFVNFSALSSLTGVISFDEISLARPLVNLEVDHAGQTNIQRDFASNTAEAEPVEEQENAETLALFFNLISISAGEINVLDHSQGEAFKTSIQPFNLALNNFSTTNNEGGDYELAIALGKGQQINWKGQIGIAPFHSKGYLALKNIHSDSFWHYVKNVSPYWLNNASISIEGQYDTSIKDQQTLLLVDKGFLSIQELAVAEHATSNNLLELETLSLGPITFDLNQRQLALGEISLDKPVISALRYPNNKINLLLPLEDNTPSQTNETTISQTEDKIDEASQAAATAPQKQDSQGKQAFKWSINSVTINDGAIRWVDQALTKPANLLLDKLNISLGQLSEDLSKPFPYQLSFKTGVGQHSLAGNLSPAPFSVEGDLAIQTFPLDWLQNYVSESANITLDSGTVDFNSQYRLLMSETLNGQIKADISVDNIAVSDTGLAKPLTGFDQLAIGPISIELGGIQNINIDSIKLIKPYGEVFIAKDGQLNLANISTEKTSTDEQGTVKESTSEAETRKQEIDTNAPADDAQNSPNIAINKIIIQEGRFEFTDASQNPTVNTYFDQVTGSIENLSSDVENKSKVDIQGNLETYGKLFVRGTLNPLSQKPYTDLGIKVSNINLSTASPYSAKFAGYQIDKGKLDLNLAYKIDDKKLQANNHIFIDQFEFGDSVDSPDATSLPLPLAIGIMKNLDGEIDIDLPISGDLDDPSFSIGSVVFSAFTNLITKIVTSPFAILGSLVEGGDDISSVEFLAGQASLSTDQQAKVMKLAKALKERPKLNLEIRGIADASVDGDIDLTVLAKNRARAMTQEVIEQGGIDKQRVFVLEPQIITPKEKTQNFDAAATISSNFTISVP